MESMLVKSEAIRAYVTGVLELWPSWSKGSDSSLSRVIKIHSLITRLLFKYRIPEAAYSTTSGSGVNGEFNLKLWRLMMSEEALAGQNLTKEKFLSAVETSYIGACYVEESWLVMVDFLFARRRLKWGQYCVLEDDIWSLKEGGLDAPLRIFDQAAVVARNLPEQIGTRNSFTVDKKKVQELLQQALLQGFSSSSQPLVVTNLRPVPPPPPVVKNLRPVAPPPPVATNLRPVTPTSPVVPPSAPPTNQPGVSPMPISPISSIISTTSGTNDLKDNGVLGADGNLQPYKRWPELMLTDDRVVQEYVQRLCAYWDRSATRDTKEAVVIEIGRTLEHIHKLCGIPTVWYEPFYAPPHSGGTFSPGRWTIQVNVNRIPDSGLTKEIFLTLAETIYHEGRHTEQEWLLLIQWLFEKRVWIARNGIYRYEVYERDLSDIKFSTLIPRDIVELALDIALARPEPPKGPSGKVRVGYKLFIEMVNTWRDSNYTTGRLQTSSIYRNLDRATSYNYHKYRDLPAESDAFYIQEPIRQEFEKRAEFKQAVINTRPDPCSFCSGHSSSGLWNNPHG